MSEKYRVAATVKIYVDTYFTDDGKTDLKDQAYEQVRDLLFPIEHTSDIEDVIEIADIDTEFVREE